MVGFVNSENIWIELFFGKCLGCFLAILTFPYDLICFKLKLVDSMDGKVAIADGTSYDA